MRLTAASGQQLLFLAACLSITSASPYPRDDLHDLGWSFLQPRQCASYCGEDNQYCCSQGEVCTTVDGGVATCTAGELVPAYTTTWTRTYTSTAYTEWAPAPAPTAGVNCIPQNSQQQACGTICCAGWQTCAYQGQCSAKPGYQAPSTVVVTTNGVVTTQYSAPYRVTGVTTVVGVSSPATVMATTTSTSSSAAATGTSSGDTGAAGTTHSGGSGLSGGAIAGIVIGSLAGVALLILLCFCCIVRGLWDLIFGRSKKKEREHVDVYEERYSRHGSRVGSGRDRHSGWFGGGGRRPPPPPENEKHSSGKRWLGLAGLAATMLALLNLRKDKDRRPPPSKGPRSRYSNSYYSYSDYTSRAGSSSSGARTHHSRRTRDSRVTRGTRPGSYGGSRAPSRRP